MAARWTAAEKFLASRWRQDFGYDRLGGGYAYRVRPFCHSKRGSHSLNLVEMVCPGTREAHDFCSAVRKLDAGRRFVDERYSQDRFQRVEPTADRRDADAELPRAGAECLRLRGSNGDRPK